MFLVNEVLLGSHDGKVVFNCARVVLWVEINLSIGGESITECESKSITESESGIIKCEGNIKKMVDVSRVEVNLSFKSERITESESVKILSEFENMGSYCGWKKTCQLKVKAKS